MWALTGTALASCLTIFVSHSALAFGINCSELIAPTGPIGQLIEVDRAAGGSTGGEWQSDESGTTWFVKRDVHYSELQTSAEAIASQIYRHFGYTTPDTVVFYHNGIRSSASRDIGPNHYATDFSNMNSSETRQIRVVAAYLKDWDRLATRSNNRKMIDGSVVILDFGGALGSRAQGRHKPGPVFSDAIGNFEATTDINTIYSSFNVEASPNHPWMEINRAHIQAVVQKFKLLTDEKIEGIVASAQYSSETDHDYMVRALKLRRDGIIANLLPLFP